MFDRIVVAIPARNEARCIERCLRSVDASAGLVQIPVDVVVAADTCTDATAASARSVELHSCRLTVIEGAWGRAGAARHAAVRFALETDPANGNRETTAGTGTWIANTDADCVVGDEWLQVHLRLALRYDAIAGLVRLDPASTSHSLLDAFTRYYTIGRDSHGHVHGANIGLSAHSYGSVGGWCRQTVVGEDHVLWRALRTRNQRLRQSNKLIVTTSSRTRSRVTGGFATDLAQLSPI